MTIKELIKFGLTGLKEAGIEAYESDAKLLAMHVLGIGYTELFLNYDCTVEKKKIDEYAALIEQRSTHFPCQYITGEQDFMGYTFKTMPGVLIPRPETELLVEEALSMTMDRDVVRLLDMCSGSGCIGISYRLLRLQKGYAEDIVELADISEDAINLSAQNNLELKADCNIIRTDLFSEISGKYDIIVSNPPYIKTADIEDLMEDVVKYEPVLALDGREDGLYFYRKIIKEARNYLNEDGMLLFETGHNQHEDIRALLIDSRYEDIRLIKDYAGLDRIITARVSKRSI